MELTPMQKFEIAVTKFVQALPVPPEHKTTHRLYHAGNGRYELVLASGYKCYVRPYRDFVQLCV